MVEQVQPPSPTTFAGGAEAVDLCAEIAGQVEREPSDRVSCRHVFRNYYRCNWWAPASANDYDNPSMYGSTVTTHRVRKSAFLRVIRTRNGLSISAV